MKLFLFEVAALSLLALIAAAYFFRSRRATAILRKIRLIGWIYVAMVILMALLQVVRTGW